MQIGHYIGIAMVFFGLVLVAVRSSKNVNQSTFGGYKGSGAFVVSGALMGTLVGGASTIGTAQLAYNYGFSAWWFTLGGGIGVIALGILISKKIYHTDTKTLPEILEREYGKGNAVLVAALNSIGTFLSVVAQIISAMALLAVISNLNLIWQLFIILILIIIYVVFGGALSIGYAGVLKTILISLTVLICGSVAIANQKDISLVFGTLETAKYFNVFARGFVVDFGAGFSLLIGVITTQSYISAILMAKDLKVLRKGVWMTAIIVPVIGIAGIIVGLYMKVNYPDIDSKMALPFFIMEKIPPVLGGIMFGTLLLAVVGTAAGLTFGMSKMLYQNFLSKYYKNEVVTQRCCILIILLASIMFSYGEFGSMILSWSFMSMGLRGAAAFVPMLLAVMCPGKIKSSFVTVAIVSGPLFTLIGKIILPSSIDPLFLGLLVSLLVIAVAFVCGREKA